ncbi:MAG: MAPEG family protein [Woeseiaceae bacterium]
MQQDAIFQPFIGMLVLTFVVWVHLYVRRIAYMRAERIHPQKLTTPDKRNNLIPEDVSYPAFNFRNLLELPMLFYVVCLYLYVAGSVDAFYVYAAWWFFAFRIVHSMIHCTVNRVYWRFYAYALSALGLWLMIARIVVDRLLN